MARITSFLIGLSAALLIWFSFSTLQNRMTSLATDPGHAQSQAIFSAEDAETKHDAGDTFLIGLGRGDITGPVVEMNFMGYAHPAQTGSGVRQRIYSRAFIVGDPQNPKDRVVYLVLDTQSGDTAVRNGILEALEDLGPEYAMYGQHNIAVSATHSHSGPGAYNNYLLPQITSKGFSKASYQAIVDGAVQSIRQAHERLALGHLSVGTVEIPDANINRSPYAYLANPEEERKRYKHDADKTMTLLRFTQTTDDGSEEDVGVFTWYATHGTSVMANNTLVTGDNKGVAAYLFEQAISGSDDNHPSFVAGFSQANVADVSPNILGAYCEYGSQAGQLCDFETSLCGGKSKPCVARGPYFRHNAYDSGAASGFEIGRRQFSAAYNLWKASRTTFAPVRGPVVRSFHQFVDFSTLEFTLSNGTVAKTCPAALGYSFAAGTTDWPGAFDFKQGQPHDHNANPLWSLVGDRIARPNDTQRACHREKPILLDVGESESPYAWSPNIVDVQTFRIGNLFLVVAPGEVSTMAGRRWREAVHSAAASTLTTEEAAPVVLLGGLANTYTHYIVTPEEYTRQRFEGASTLYGPWTLDAHIHLTLQLLPYLSSSSATLPPLDPGPSPPINTNDSLSFISPVVMDRTPLFKSFGDIVHDVSSSSFHPGDTISATFVGANPRNNLRLESTFAAVEKFDDTSNTWKTVRTDRDWSLVYEWKRTSTALGTSQVTVRWETRWETGTWRQHPDGSQSAAVVSSSEEEVLDEDTRDELRKRGISHRAAGSSSRVDTEDKDLPRLHAGGKYRLRYFGDAKSWNGGGITSFEGTSAEFVLV